MAARVSASTKGPGGVDLAGAGTTAGAQNTPTARTQASFPERTVGKQLRAKGWSVSKVTNIGSRVER